MGFFKQRKNSEHGGTARAILGGAARVIPNLEHWRIFPGSAAAYALATLCVAVATLLHWGIGFISETLSALRHTIPQC